MSSKTVSLVQRADAFFDDAFFKDTWTDFDSAMQTVLDKFDNKGLKIDSGSRNQCRDVYRNIRSSKIDEDIYASQALQVTEKDGRFNCVMDVKDFNPNDLQVKVVEDRVVVEGKYEKKSEDGSSMSSKSFYKEFTLPGAANLDFVTTALSKDGVLTVRAPKKDGAEVAVGSPNSKSSAVEKTSSSSVQQSSSVSQNSSSVSSSVKKQSFSSSKSFSTSSTSSQQVSSTSNVTSSNVNQTAALDGGLGDLSKDVNDRLVFTHESVNLKLPQN